MVNMTVFFSDLQAGRSSSTVQVRLLRYWEARNFRRGGELMGVDMLLLDSQAVGIHKQLERMVVDPRVIVATSVNPKMVGGRLFLNATSGTHIYFDKETSAGEQLFYRRLILFVPVTSLESSSTRVGAMSPVRSVSRNCSALIRPWRVYLATTPTQLASSGISLFKLASNFTANMAYHDNIKLRSVVTVWRCQLQTKLEKGCLLDSMGVMAKLFNMRAQDAATVLVGGGDIPEETDFPQFVKEMVGKSFTFQVKVGPYNFTSNHQSFIITRILREGEREPRPDFVDESDDGGKDDASHGTGCVSSEMEVGGGSRSGGSATVSRPVKKARKV
ncbi:unnamed protein product [Eruca vesicaria subsp. sativa]|uniref:Uncharacterized protein n=1 Tax=Eruca vesicaria subsp. sativa TaxID=29727 RepID=A0ABC8L1I3_ERUVS|nr:unnamed protein product [Eruca vesicaria subsp. sativa]